MILEGAMIVIACIALTFYHPGKCFQGEWTSANFSMRGRKTQPASSAEDTEKDAEFSRIC
jgi:hypothetical protein